MIVFTLMLGWKKIFHTYFIGFLSNVLNHVRILDIFFIFYKIFNFFNFQKKLFTNFVCFHFLSHFFNFIVPATLFSIPTLVDPRDHT